MRKARKLDVVCPNKKCMTYNKIGLKNIIRFGKQANGTQRYRCVDCKRTFARTINTPFFHKHLKKKETTTPILPTRGILNSLSDLQSENGTMKHAIFFIRC